LVNDIFRYSVCFAITFGIFLLNPFIIYTANNQNVFALAFPINNSYDRLVAQMNNYDSYSSYFHYVDSFSDLSRDTTSSNSSDLLEEDNTAPTEEIGQDNINTAADSVDEPTADTNQSSSSP
jgi:cytoskeletal protein RodZ